jgi:DnaJ-like protein
MTQKKPAGKTWESFIEQQIREAMEEGAFDNLQGKGQPLPDLGIERDPDWWAKKLIEREKVSLAPPALTLRREVEQALERLPQMRNEAEVRRTLDALNERIRKLNATIAEGPPTSLAPLDVEAIVLQWRLTARRA